MVKERYVNLEVAMLLRDKGFDEKCFKIYNINNGLIFENYDTCNSELPETNEQVTAPTQAMACDWIAEKYKVFIVVRFVSKLGYVGSVCDISNPDNILYIANTRDYPSIEPLYNEALKYVLTNLV